MHKDTIIAQQTDMRCNRHLNVIEQDLQGGKNAMIYNKERGGGERERKKKESLENNYIRLILHNLIGECESTAHTTAQKVAAVYFRLARHRPASNAINTISAAILWKMRGNPTSPQWVPNDTDKDHNGDMRRPPRK